MALVNYTDLQGAVSDWMARSDLVSRIPDFILMAEARFNRQLRTREMVTSGTISLTAGVATLPSTYQEWIACEWDGASRDQTLRYCEPDSEEWRRRYRPNGDPQMFTIIGASLKVRPVGAGSVILDYYRTIPDLATNTTNWLMTKSPDLYLAMSKFFAKDYIGDEEKKAAAIAEAESEMQKALMDDDGGKMSRRPGREVSKADQANAKSDVGL
jgi:hypothetical protein